MQTTVPGLQHLQRAAACWHMKDTLPANSLDMHPVLLSPATLTTREAYLNIRSCILHTFPAGALQLRLPRHGDPARGACALLTATVTVVNNVCVAM